METILVLTDIALDIVILIWLAELMKEGLISGGDMVITGHAKWGDWPNVGECYRVRNRGYESAFSREGFVWTNARGKAVGRPAEIIQFHGGPMDGKIVAKGVDHGTGGGNE